MSKYDEKYFANALNYMKNVGEKNQKLYEIVVAILLLFPIFISPIIAAVWSYVIGIGCLLFCWGTLAIIVILRKNRIINSFYQVKNAHTKFKKINVDTTETIYELYNDSALTFINTPDDKLLDFIFNWLNSKNALKSDSLDLYIFNGKLLKQAFESSRFDENEIFFSIFLKDLNLNKSNLKEVSNEHFLIGARWFDDIIHNDKKISENSLKNNKESKTNNNSKNPNYTKQTDDYGMEIWCDAMNDKVLEYATHIVEKYVEQKDKILDYFLDISLRDFYGTNFNYSDQYIKENLGKPHIDIWVENVDDKEKFFGTIEFRENKLDEHLISIEFRDSLIFDDYMKFDG